MWSIEDVLSELKEEEEVTEGKKRERGGLPPGFRFHPTDEELIAFYLASKVFNPLHSSCNFLFTPPGAVDIPEVDLNRCEPWDLPENAKMGEREWYFYSVRDRKYPSGLRTNRATGSGYWKATGKDRHVYAAASSKANPAMIGMKKTLVFYQGRAPRGVKTPWVMHEYRLDGHFSSFRLSSSKEEWVICRIFHKHGGGGGNESKKAKSSSSDYNNNNFTISSSLPPLLETPTTKAATNSSSTPPLPPPLPSLLSYFSSLPLPNPTTAAATSTTTVPIMPPISSILFDDFHRPPLYLEALPLLNSTTFNDPISTMKLQDYKLQQNWLDKIIPLQQNHQISDSNHSSSYHNCYQQVVIDNDKFGDHIEPTNIDMVSGFSDNDADVSASLAAAAALDRLLDTPIIVLPGQSYA